MKRFNRVFPSALRLRPKFRQSLRKHVPEPTVWDVQLSTDTLVQEAVEEEFEAQDNHVNKNNTGLDVHSTESSADEDVEVDEYDDDDDDDDDDDTPWVFLYDLARKIHYAKMTYSIYIALTDNDREIAALRTEQDDKFTHIVRVAFDPLSPHNNSTRPSSWASNVTYSTNGSSELRLTCPAMTLHFNRSAALLRGQLLATRKYMTDVLPHRNHKWAAQGLKFSFSPEECRDSLVLVVGSNDRFADVMAILVCYLAFLAGTTAGHLLARLQLLVPIRTRWRDDTLSEGSLEFVNKASKQPWKA